MERHIYRIRDMKASSDRFGNCEVCHKPVRVVFYQAEMREYQPNCFTYHSCSSYYGHFKCLTAVRH